MITRRDPIAGVPARVIPRALKGLWIAAAVIVLAFTLYAFDGKPNSDIGILFAWYMLALSFPASLVVPLVHVALFDGLGIAVESSYSSFVLDWLGFFLVGYLQWFVVVPWLWRKWKVVHVR